MSALGGGCLVPGVSALGGAWSRGGLLLGGGVPDGDPIRAATAAGGTDYTGMHSCCK